MRKPLLTDEMMSTENFSTNAGGAHASWTDHMSAHDVRDFYENLINEGELIPRSELMSWLVERMGNDDVKPTDNFWSRIAESNRLSARTTAYAAMAMRFGGFKTNILL